MTHSIKLFKTYRFIYTLLGISINIGTLSLYSYFVFFHLHWSAWNILWMILFMATHLFGFLALGAAFGMSAANSRYPFFVAPITLINNNKIVYHDQLGYFIINVFDNSVDICKQTPFYETTISNIAYDGNVDTLANNIKTKLDSHYQQKIHEDSKRDTERKQKLEKLQRIKNWDGYLDKTGKRDKKIQEII